MEEPPQDDSDIKNSLENSIYFEEDLASSISEEEDSESRNISDIVEEKASYFPFTNKETALLYLWANLQPRISTRKLQLLLDVLHTPDFDVRNLPTSTYRMNKVEKKIPILKIS